MGIANFLKSVKPLSLEDIVAQAKEAELQNNWSRAEALFICAQKRAKNDGEIKIFGDKASDNYYKALSSRANARDAQARAAAKKYGLD